MNVAKPGERLILVTGSPRSGTTLIDKLLGEFEDVDFFSQPLPLILVAAKRNFLERIAHPTADGPYPLSDQQFANSYSPDSFVEFLRDRPLSLAEIQQAMDLMDDYSGQYFKTSAAARHPVTWRDDSLVALADHYFRTFGQGAPIAAWKEVYAEEYIPSLLDAGGRAILVLRDPRDVAASLNQGNGDHAGGRRPLLWIARQWRKSAAYALRYANIPTVSICHYESVVRDPEDVMAGWREFLGPGPASTWRQDAPLRDATGMAWKSNSSFQQRDGVVAEGIGRYAQLLPEPELHLLEALCFAEMRALGYQPTIDVAQVEPLVRNAPDEIAERSALSALAWSTDRQVEEIKRWRSLTSPRPDYSDAMFIFEQSYHALRRALAA